MQAPNHSIDVPVDDLLNDLDHANTSIDELVSSLSMVPEDETKSIQTNDDKEPEEIFNTEPMPVFNNKDGKP